MAIERTFSIIKPDATKRNLTGKIIDRFESNGLRIIASKRIHMTREQAGDFYTRTRRSRRNTRWPPTGLSRRSRRHR